jgi:hypothetical protein
MKPMQKTYSLAACNPNSIAKLKIECIDEEDGSMTIHIEWDENDPDLQWWTDLGPEGQESFIIDSLRKACACYDD